MRFLFVDRILDVVPGERIQGLKHVTADDFYLLPGPGGDWHFMPALIGETLGQLAAWNVMLCNQFRARPVAGIVAEVRLGRSAPVGSTLFLDAQIERLDETAVQYQARASIAGEMAAEVIGALGPLLPMDDFIAADTVRRQFDEINRPASLPVFAEPQAFTPATPSHRCTPPAFDALMDFRSGQSMQMVKHISRSAPFFPDHFPRKPVLPMTMLIQSKMNMADYFIAHSRLTAHWRLRRLQRIKMNEFVYPGDSVLSTLNVKQQTADALVLSFRSEVAGKRVCVMEAVFERREENNA
ncbi:MAG: hydroxymyristoyl-ACP dehydratase [Legionellaceae bacterium]|nr:hydroxymyristoyl-ACP dehydratase [Legionellaceae bacterium]